MTAYGFFAAAGAVAAIVWLRRHHRAMGLSDNEFWAALWLMVLAGIVGAKGLFVLLGWHHYEDGELRFWADFRTGFVFFGGLCGAVVAGGLFAWRRRLNFWRGADYFAVALPIGHAIGRVGCYAQGCCVGREPHPVQLYESAGLLVIALAAHRVLTLVRLDGLSRGSAICAYAFLYGMLRLSLDPLRADGRPERFLGLSHQQGMAIGLMLAGAFAFWWLQRQLRVASPSMAPAVRSRPSRSS
jgi:phosphatidylglycerol:prolipoprotein diacylglycerol transferase